MARGARGRSERAMGGRVRDGCCGKGSREREREREVRGLEWGVTRGGRERGRGERGNGTRKDAATIC